MKAQLNGTVIAEAPKEELIYIEGSWYFPMEAVNLDLLRKSPTEYRCPWKGDAQYFDVGQDDQWCEDCAFGYPDPKPSAIDTVKRDFSHHIAFWRDVEVVE